MKYQVGHLTMFEFDDPKFDTLEEVAAYIQRKFDKCDHPVGIWTSQEDGSELLYIYHQGGWYREVPAP